MRRLAAVIVLLCGASVLAPVTSADAAMRPAGLAAATAHAGLLMPEIGAAGHSQPLPGGFVLVQYNEGGGGGGGYSRPYNSGGGGYSNGGGGGYSRPSNGGGYSRPYNNGGGYRRNNGGGNNAVNGAAAVIGIITMLRQQQIMQQQQELLKRQQRQQYQYQYNNHLRQNQARREQELHNERAKENERKVNLEKARKEERLQEELEETKKQLNDQNRAHNYPPATPQPVPAPVDPDPYHDRVGDIVVNIIPAPDNCPDNFQELRVGATVLYPRRTDFPADRSLCAGVTEKGCYLKVENTPATCGASRQVCVARCPGPLPTKEVDIRPPYVVPTPIVPPTPVVIPTPAGCGGANCPPQPQPQPICSGGNCPPPPCYGSNCGRTADLNCSGGNCPPQPQPYPVCNGGNCAPQPVVNRPKPTKPAVRTVIAYNYVEPDRPKPTKPAVRTVIAYNYVEPDHPKPTKPAVRTVIAYNYVEPDRPKPTKPAARTVIAHNYVEHDRPKPTKPAVRTVIAHNYVEHDHPKPTKPAVRTVIAHDYVEHDHPKPIKPAVPTVKSHVEQKRTENTKPAVKSHEGELDEVIYDPVKCPNLNFACADLLRADEKKEEEAKKKREEEDAFDRKVDSKNCTGNGGLSNASLRNSTDYRSLMLCITNNCKPMETSDASFNHLLTAKVRDATTGLIAAIPEKLFKYGGALSGVVKFLWDDPTPDAVFSQMKDYVDKLVPEKISEEHYNNLTSLIDGTRRNLRWYRLSTEPSSQGGALAAMDNDLSTRRGEFDDPDHPEQMLAYFVAFGTLDLAVMREEYLHTKEIFCAPGEDYSNSQRCAKQHRTYLDELNQGVDDFTADAKKFKKNILAWRLNKIHVNTDHYEKALQSYSEDWGLPDTYKVYTATAADDFCDTSLWHPATHEHSELDHDDDDTTHAQDDADARKAAVTKAFGHNLDLILAPLTNWASSTVEAAPVTAPGRQAAR